MTGWWFPWDVEPILLAGDCQWYKKSRKKRPTSYSRRARQLKKRHIEVFGCVCLGDENHPAHPVKIEDLSVDHVIPVYQGGSHQIENLRVLCKEWNKKRHAAVPSKRNRRKKN